MQFTNYWLPLLWIMTGGIFIDMVFQKRRVTVMGKTQVCWSRYSAFFVALPFILFAAFRTDMFGDTGAYRAGFYETPTAAAQIWPYIRDASKDKGFVAFRVAVKLFLTNDPVVYFFIIAAIQMLCLAFTYRKFSCDMWLSIFLFVASTDYFGWMHNGMRQFLAAALIFAAFPLLVQKKYVHMVIITLCASLIHATSLVFLPFIFIVQGKAWNRLTLFFILAVVASVVFLDEFTGLVTETMEETQYASEIEQFTEDDGTNIMRVLFYAVPCVAALVFKRRIDRINDPVINVCTNLSIASTGFYVLSFFTSGILMGRVPIFFSLSNYILLPWLIHRLFNKNSAALLKVVLCLVYIAFYYYQMGITWGLL